MPSTRYPGSYFSFPWLTLEAYADFDCVMYPNWRRGNRPPLDPNTSHDRIVHDGCPAGSKAVLDFDLMFYLWRLKTDDRVIMEFQDSDGSEIHTVVARIQEIYWAGGSFPRINYSCNGDRSAWPTFLLAIAPFNPYYRDEFKEQEHIWEVPEGEPGTITDHPSQFLGLVKKYGIRRANRMDIPLFQVGSFSEFDRGAVVRQCIEGEHLLRPGDVVEWEAGSNLHGFAEIVTADDTPSDGYTNVTIRRRS